MILYLGLKQVSVITLRKITIASFTMPSSISVITHFLVALPFPNHQWASSVAEVVHLYKRKGCFYRNPVGLVRSTKSLILNLSHHLPHINSSTRSTLLGNRLRGNVLPLSLKPVSQSVGFWEISIYEKLTTCDCSHRFPTKFTNPSSLHSQDGEASRITHFLQLLSLLIAEGTPHR
eukprot:Gb_20423 [translate_table: standard]